MTEGDILNISPAVVWVIALSQLLTFGLTVWNIMASGSRANSRKLDEHASVLVQHSHRIGGLELTQVNLPKQADLHSFGIAVEQLRGEIKALHAEMAGEREFLKRLETVINRQEDHLLKGVRAP